MSDMPDKRKVEAKDFLEGTEEIEVNEYGEIVPKKGRKVGVKLKPFTFY